MKITAKQKLTIFSISDWMAHTQKQEIEVVSVLDVPEARRAYQSGPIEAYRFGSMKPRGKRKLFHLDVKNEALVFEGWDLPIKTDSEVKGGSFSGNACYNLGGMDACEMRRFIETLNLNGPMTDDVKGKCIRCNNTIEGVGVFDDGELLWPDINVAHAVVNRMKEKIAA